MNLSYEAKQHQETSMLEVTKSGIRLCGAETAMLIGQTNFEILNFRRAKTMPDLNYSYRQLSFDQGDHSKLLFGDNLPKQIKDISETNIVGFAISRKSFTPSIYPFPLINLHKIKISLLFCTEAGGHQEEDLVHVESVAPISSKLQKTVEPVPIQQQELQLKTKAEMPVHCETQVRKI